MPVAGSERRFHANALKVRLVIGRLVKVEAFPEARKPAYKVTVDFGSDIGVRTTSAQLPPTYPDSAASLSPGRPILAVVNFPKKKIAGFASEFLLAGVPTTDDRVVLMSIPDASCSLASASLCGWSWSAQCSTISWADFEAAKVQVGRVVDVVSLERLSVRVADDRPPLAVHVPEQYALLSADSLSGKLVLFAPSETEGDFVLLCIPTSNGAAAIPLGVDLAEHVKVGGFLF